MMEEQPIEPTSGNAVPPGSLPEEVKDDVDAKLSKGEYVIPADVVRYFGLAKIEGMVKKAKESLASLAEEGRVGGKAPEDELPFSEEELQTIEEEAGAGAAPPLKMATGGFVDTLSDEELKMYERPVKPLATPTGGGREVAGSTGRLTGTAGSVDQWTLEDFNSYAKQTRSGVGKAITTGLTSIAPITKPIVEARTKYLDEAVPSSLDKMLKSGVDQQGKTISKESGAALKDLQGRLSKDKAEKDKQKETGKGGLLGGLIDKAKSAVSGSNSKTSKSSKTSDKKKT